MLNFLAVIAGTIALGWALFFYRPRAHKWLSASRWMLLAWGLLILVHVASPIDYRTLTISPLTWLYCGFWIGAFVLADNVRFTLWTNSIPEHPSLPPSYYSVATMRALAALSCIGAAILIHTRLNTIASFDIQTVLLDVRETQIAGTDIGMIKTVTTVLACCGLPVALVEVCHAIRTRASIPLRGWIALLAYLAVPISAGGRSGFLLGTMSLLISVFTSIHLTGLGLARFRKLLLVGGFMIAATIGYIMMVVTSRGNGFVGGLDKEVTFMNSLWDCDLQTQFQESIRPYGALGDTVLTSFYYLSPQIYGLDFGLHYYHGPFIMGGNQFQEFTRRIENLFGVQILEPVDKADTRIFDEIGFYPHFFRTAVDDVYKDFGMVFSIPYVFICGVLSRRARVRALRSKEPFSIALQALVCSGAAFTVIGSPFGEGTFFFPLLWFVLIDVFFEVARLIVLAPSRSASTAC